MGEKVYKPILKDGDHLVHSKSNPQRVRGLTRDENNQNPDINEWEEIDVDDLLSNNSYSFPPEEDHMQLTPEQEQLAQQVGEALGTAIATATIILFQKVIIPHIRSNVWPWMKQKGQSLKKMISPKKSKKLASASKCDIKKEPSSDKSLTEVSSQIDKAFEELYFEMDEQEANEHIMKLIYHMLGMANEIRIISNSKIRRNCQSEELCIKRQHEAEKFLSERVAIHLNQLLSNKNLQLNLDTSRELLLLTGGGVYLNGEYAPVQSLKIDEVLKKLPHQNMESFNEKGDSYEQQC